MNDRACRPNRRPLTAMVLLAVISLLLSACSGSATNFSSTAFSCDTPRQRGDWTRVDERDTIGQWHEYTNGDGKRFRSGRLTVKEVQASMDNFFTGDAGGLVSAFDNLRLMLGDEVGNLNLVEMEFSTDSQKPEAMLVVDAVTVRGEDRRGIAIRRGQGHYDLLQLRGAGKDSAIIKAQLRAFSSGCSPVL